MCSFLRSAWSTTEADTGWSRSGSLGTVLLEDRDEFADDPQAVGVVRIEHNGGEAGIEWLEFDGLVFPAILGQRFFGMVLFQSVPSAVIRAG